MGQDFHPAVPPKLTPKRPLAPHTDICAALVTGAVPVGSYLVSRSPRPRKSIRRNVRRRDFTAHDSLLDDLLPVTCLAHRFACVALYAHRRKMSIPFYTFFHCIAKFFPAPLSPRRRYIPISAPAILLLRHTYLINRYETRRSTSRLNRMIRAGSQTWRTETMSVLLATKK